MLQIIKQEQEFIVGLLMATGIALLGFRLCGVQLNRRAAEQLHLHTSHAVFKDTASKAAVCLSEMQCFFLLNLTGTAGVCGFLFGVLWQVFIGGRGNVHIPTLTRRRPLSIEKEFFLEAFFIFLVGSFKIYSLRVGTIRENCNLSGRWRAEFQSPD